MDIGDEVGWPIYYPSWVRSMRIDQARIGLRVKDEFLGEGEVWRTCYKTGMALVRFDHTPPFEYNCCANPCWRFPGTLEPAAGREER